MTDENEKRDEADRRFDAARKRFHSVESNRQLLIALAKRGKELIKRMASKTPNGPEYSFCESEVATGRGKWCIRKLTSVGHKPGGGIDSSSLCGHVRARRGWDVLAPMTAFHVRVNTCDKCRELYAAEQ